MSTEAAGRSVFEVLKEDHREVEQLFEQARSAPDPESRKEVADRIIAELIRHAVAEEQYLYPAVREHLGDERADEEIREHAAAEQTMKDIERLKADDPELGTKLSVLETEVRQHIAEEEDEVFPALGERLSADELADLGEKVTMAKKVAPTHPHPLSPDTPPLNKLLGPGVGLVDRMRDLLTGRKT